MVLAHFQRLFGRRDPDVFLENEGKIHEGGCVEEFLSLTCRLQDPQIRGGGGSCPPTTFLLSQKNV